MQSHQGDDDLNQAWQKSVADVVAVLVVKLKLDLKINNSLKSLELYSTGLIC